MSTTTLRLPDELKSRVAAAAEAAGLTAHGFMLQAIEAQTAAAEAQAAFEQMAARRLKQLEQTGEYHTLDEVRDYLLARARGEDVERPKPRKLADDERARLRSRAR